MARRKSAQVTEPVTSTESEAVLDYVETDAEPVTAETAAEINPDPDVKTETMAYSSPGFGGETIIAHADAPYSRGIAWTDAGLDVAATFSSAEAIEAAKLDWQVEVGPVVNANTGQPISNFSVVYRTDSGAALGMSRGRYTPLQNSEMFEWTDTLVQDGQARYVSAGSFFGGKKVWLLMEMGDGATIAGEEYRQFLMALTGHDMDTAFRAFTTEMRVYCYNTFQMAVGRQDNGVRVHHHAKIHAKLSEASRIMAITTEQQRAFAAWAEQMAETPLKRGQYDKVQTALFGEAGDSMPKITAGRMELFRDIWTIESKKNGESAYSLVNTVTGYADHSLKQNTGKDASDAQRAEARLNSIVEGSARDFKATGLRAIAEMVKVPLPR